LLIVWHKTMLINYNTTAGFVVSEYWGLWSNTPWSLDNLYEFVVHYTKIQLNLFLCHRQFIHCLALTCTVQYLQYTYQDWRRFQWTETFCCLRFTDYLFPSLLYFSFTWLNYSRRFDGVLDIRDEFCTACTAYEAILGVRKDITPNALERRTDLIFFTPIKSNIMPSIEKNDFSGLCSGPQYGPII
jgi:hypothetical protein